MSEIRPNVIIIGDPGKDQDDELTFIMAALFHRIKRIRILAVVANLAPSMMRARLAKGTFNVLGLSEIPVGVGTNCRSTESAKDDYQFDVPYLADESEVEEDGHDLLVRRLEHAEDGSVTLLLISGMSDAAALVLLHDDLVQRKVARVAIMGGVKSEDGVPDRSANEYKREMLWPDSAANNMFDIRAADLLYHRLQELGVPMIILMREAAYAAAMPRATYDKMAATGHPVGIRLRDAQQASIEGLWRRCCMDDDDPDREGLPPRCNTDWFCNVFLAGEGKDRNGNDSIWDLVQNFQMYDPMALLAAFSGGRDDFFEVVEVADEVAGVTHRIIGLTKEDHGVADAEAVRAELMSALLDGLSG